MDSRDAYIQHLKKYRQTVRLKEIENKGEAVRSTRVGVSPPDRGSDSHSASTTKNSGSGSTRHSVSATSRSSTQ